MKNASAKDRASDFARRYLGGVGPHQERQMRALERLLKEYARDQRHACAGEVVNIDWSGLPGSEDTITAVLDATHAVVMNTPFPGEGLDA